MKLKTILLTLATILFATANAHGAILKASYEGFIAGTIYGDAPVGARNLYETGDWFKMNFTLDTSSLYSEEILDDEVSGLPVVTVRFYEDFSFSFESEYDSFSFDSATSDQRMYAILEPLSLGGPFDNVTYQIRFGLGFHFKDATCIDGIDRSCEDRRHNLGVFQPITGAVDLFSDDWITQAKTNDATVVNTAFPDDYDAMYIPTTAEYSVVHVPAPESLGLMSLGLALFLRKRKFIVV